VPPAVLAARRAALVRLLDSAGGGVAVVPSAEEQSIEGDYPQDSDYRERNDFFYLTGLERAESYLVVVARESGPDQVILYLPRRDSMAERWTGPKPAPGPEAAAATGITEIRPSDSAATQIQALARGATRWLDPRRPRGQEPPEWLAALAPARPLDSLTAHLRLVKDADEIARLNRAIDVTEEAHRAAMAAVEPGMTEYELEALIEYVFRRGGAERVGFPSIVGSGPNSTTLHYDKNRRKMGAGELVVMDIGAEFGYYSADVTRTIPVSGRFTERQRKLYDLVLATQQAAIDSSRPGMTIGRLNGIARRYMRDHSGDLCAPVTCDRYFVHGLSHWLGMDVHDVGDYSRPLAPGMVFTIEPGIYIPAERIGIRIEDDVLVTTGAPVLMSAGAPRTASEVERAMAAPRRSTASFSPEPATQSAGSSGPE
jgi:Xaa-Pro aminopeptidase